MRDKTAFGTRYFTQGFNHESSLASVAKPESEYSGRQVQVADPEEQ